MQQLQFTTLTVPVPSSYQGFWDIIRQVGRGGKPWSLMDVLDLTRGGARSATLRDYVKKLLRAGFVAALDQAGRPQQTLYRLVKDQPEAPSLNYDGSPAKEVGLGRAQMWRAMKMIQTFDSRSLALYATTEDCKVTTEAAHQYISALKRAGYLVEISAAQRGGSARMRKRATFRLIPTMNTGPLAPQVSRTYWVWDQNRHQVMGPEAGAAKGGGQ
jgi:hypothetical protein